MCAIERIVEEGVVVEGAAATVLIWLIVMKQWMDSNSWRQGQKTAPRLAPARWFLSLISSRIYLYASICDTTYVVMEALRLEDDCIQ